MTVRHSSARRSGFSNSTTGCHRRKPARWAGGLAGRLIAGSRYTRSECLVRWGHGASATAGLHASNGKYLQLPLQPRPTRQSFRKCTRRNGDDDVKTGNGDITRTFIFKDFTIRVPFFCLLQIHLCSSELCHRCLRATRRPFLLPVAPHLRNSRCDTEND